MVPNINNYAKHRHHRRIYAVFAIYAPQMHSLRLSLHTFFPQDYTIRVFLFPYQVSVPLVLAGCRLARLELVQVPTTDSQTTLVLVHALAEALHVICARTRLSHLSGRCISGLVLGGEFGVLRRGLCGGRGTASKPAADCVANGRSYCDTAIMGVSQLYLWFEIRTIFSTFLPMTAAWQWVAQNGFVVENGWMPRIYLRSGTSHLSKQTRSLRCRSLSLLLRGRMSAGWCARGSSGG